MLRWISDWIFWLYDWCYIRWYRLNRPESRAGNVILFHLTTRGGEQIVSIHINQEKTREMQKTAPTGRATIKLRRDFAQSLRILAHALATRPRYRNVCAITGNTVLYREAEYFGFDVIPRRGPGIVERLAMANAEALILRIRKSKSPNTPPIRKHRRAYEIRMSREYLLSHYFPKP